MELPSDVEELIRVIHGSKTKAVVYATGGAVQVGGCEQAPWPAHTSSWLGSSWHLCVLVQFVVAQSLHVCYNTCSLYRGFSRCRELLQRCWRPPCRTAETA